MSDLCETSRPVRNTHTSLRQAGLYCAWDQCQAEAAQMAQGGHERQKLWCVYNKLEMKMFWTISTPFGLMIVDQRK